MSPDEYIVWKVLFLFESNYFLHRDPVRRILIDDNTKQNINVKWYNNPQISTDLTDGNMFIVVLKKSANPSHTFLASFNTDSV